MPKPPGKQFEADFKGSIPARCDVTRLQDAGGWSRGDDLRFTPSNPCDLIVFAARLEPDTWIGTLYKLELKSLKGKSLPFGNIKSGETPEKAEKARTKFIATLVESEKRRVRAGFVVNFRDTNETFFVLASKVQAFIAETDRASIPIAWFRVHGRLIKQELKKVHYRYDLEWM